MVYAYTNSKTIYIIDKIVVCSNDIQSKIPGTVTTDVLAINYIEAYIRNNIIPEL